MADPTVSRDRPSGAVLSTALALAGLVVLASWLRWRPLAPRSLWLDDLWVIAPSRADSLGDALGMLVTTPGFSIAVNLPLAVIGPSSIVAQAIPFVAGILAPAVALLVARSLGLRPAAAVVAGLATAVAPEHMEYSTRVKQYTVDVLFGLVVVALAWRVLRGRSNPWTLVGLAAGATVVSGSAGVYCGAITGASLLVAFRDPALRRQMMAPVLAFGVFAALWWGLYLRTHVSEGLREFWRDDFLATDDGVLAFVTDLGSSLERMAVGLTPVASGWVLLGIAAVVVAFSRWRLALLLVAPIGAAVVLATIQAAPLGTGRTDIYLLPSAVLALAIAVDVVAERIGGEQRRTLAAGVAAVVVGSLLVSSVLVRDLRPERYPLEDVRDFVVAAERGRPTDGVVVVYPSARWAYAVYTGGGFVPVDSDGPTGFDVRITTPGVEVLRPHRDAPQEYLPELAQATSGSETVLFVASHWTADIEVIDAWFPANDWTLVRREQAVGAMLVEWRRG